MHLEDGEQVRKQDTSVRYDRGKLTAPAGTLTLTNRRLAFEQVNPIAGSLGLLGMALTNVLPHQLVVNLPLGQVSSFSRGKYGLHDNVIVVNAADGSEYRFLTHYDQWASVFAKAGISQKQPAS
jgi:hypothetical protein